MNTNKIRFKFLFILALFFTASSILQAQDWNQQTSGTGENLHDIFFINQDIGWVVGNDGVIRKTLDGGDTWTGSSSGVIWDLRGVYFQNATRGWAVGKEGTLLITTDGGTSWSSTNNSGVTEHIRSVYFASDNNGWVVGDNGTNLQSTDNGVTWSTGSLPGNLAFSDIYFKNATTGWVTSKLGSIYRTTDGGDTWEESSAGSNDLTAVHFIDASTGWASTIVDTIIYKSTDGGANWTAQDISGEGNLNGVFAVSSTEVWGVGNKMTCIKTDDGGNAWNEVVVDNSTPDDLRDVFFFPGIRGWVCGEDGRIYRTDIMVSTKETWADKGYHLTGNAPNPFRENTSINFEIPQSEQVTIRVYNLNGQLIKSLAPQNYPAGTHKLEFVRNGLAEGIYFFELQAGDFLATKKMIIIK